MRVLGSLGLRKTPSISVKNTNLLAFKARATPVATSSALILKALYLESNHTVEIIGV